MVPSNKAYDLIKKWESYANVAYICPAGKWTKGFGHTLGVSKGDICSPAEAQMLLEADCVTALTLINQTVYGLISQSLLFALVSFVFNVGVGDFQSSTMLKLLNEREYGKACGEFQKWVHSNGKELKGLVDRRAAEAALFRG